MNWDALLAAPLAIQVHAFAAIGAFFLGGFQLLAPKGTVPHRTVGWIWVVLMGIVCATAFFIHEIRLWGPWSPIHILAVTTPIAIGFAILGARRHNVTAHKRGMMLTYFGALIIAGAFTFLPGRIMHAVFFGGP